MNVSVNLGNIDQVRRPSEKILLLYFELNIMWVQPFAITDKRTTENKRQRDFNKGVHVKKKSISWIHGKEHTLKKHEGELTKTNWQDVC